MKVVQIVGLAIVGWLLALNSLNGLAIALALVAGQVADPPFVVGRLLFVLLLELGLIAIARWLLRKVRGA